MGSLAVLSQNNESGTTSKVNETIKLCQHHNLISASGASFKNMIKSQAANTIYAELWSLDLMFKLKLESGA